MGKRELLLFLGFLAFGAIVYQATAPAPEPHKEGFSFSKFMSETKAAFQGERAAAPVERTASADAPSGDGRLVIPDFRGTVTVLGEDRHDLAAELKGVVYGLDDDQAKARAQSLALTLHETGDDVSAEIQLPGEIHRRPQLELVIRAPSHVGVKLELRTGQADLRRIGDVRLENSRGKISMSEVGEVEGSTENSELEIVQARAVTLKLLRTRARLEEIGGELTLDADRGELRVTQVHGPTKLRIQHLDCEIDSLHGPIRIEPDHVNLSVRNVAAPLTVKGEHTEVVAALAEAVPVTIETSDDQIDLRVPQRQGVSIDARSDGGQIRVAESGGSEGEPTDNPDETEEPDQPEQPESEKSEKADKQKSDKQKWDKEKADRDRKEKAERREPHETREPHEPGEPIERPAPPEPPAPPSAPPGVTQPGAGAPGTLPPRLRTDRGWRPYGRDRNSSSSSSNTSSSESHDSRVQRTMIKLHGGGPLITLRNTRGDIVIR